MTEEIDDLFPGGAVRVKLHRQMEGRVTIVVPDVGVRAVAKQ